MFASLKCLFKNVYADKLVLLRKEAKLKDVKEQLIHYDINKMAFLSAPSVNHSKNMNKTGNILLHKKHKICLCNSFGGGKSICLLYNYI